MEADRSFLSRQQLGYDIIACMNVKDEEPCNEDDICENGFFDREFMDRELPDSLFDELIDRYAGDPCVQVLKTHNMVGETQISKLVFVNYEDDVIETGSRDLIPLNYYIDHDEKSVIPVMEWITRTMICNEFVDFPYVHPAKVHIDRSKKLADQHYQIQTLFMQHGYSLFEPTTFERKHCSTYGSYTARYCENTDDIPYDDKIKVFLSYRDIVETDVKSNYVAMQFNPCHPMAINKIKKIEKKEMVYEGIYEWNDREYYFRFDLMDVRYRVHSSEWQTFLGFFNPAYEVFDLVSDHDFIDVFHTQRYVPRDDENNDGTDRKSVV